MKDKLMDVGSVRRNSRVTVGKYKESRFWAIWVDGQLLAVTVYRKGALAISEYLKADEKDIRT